MDIKEQQWPRPWKKILQVQQLLLLNTISKRNSTLTNRYLNSQTSGTSRVPVAEGTPALTPSVLSQPMFSAHIGMLLPILGEVNFYQSSMWKGCFRWMHAPFEHWRHPSSVACLPPDQDETVSEMTNFWTLPRLQSTLRCTRQIARRCISRFDR